MQKLIRAGVVFAVVFMLVGAGCSTQVTQEIEGNSAVKDGMPTDETPISPTDEAPQNNGAMVAANVTADTVMVAKKPAVAPTLNVGLRAELEASYQELIAILAAGNKESFLNFIDPAKETPVPSDDEWKQALPYLQDSYPKLAETKFISVEQKSATRAYYYFLDDLEDKNFTLVSVLVFNKVEGTWRVAGTSYSNGFAKNTDAQKEEQAILKAVGELRVKADKEK